jgi:hypothetical protein
MFDSLRVSSHVTNFLAFLTCGTFDAELFSDCGFGWAHKPSSDWLCKRTLQTTLSGLVSGERDSVFANFSNTT